MDVRLLSYDEMADTFRITRESARQLTIRKRWKRTKGNDGKARVEVPVEAVDSIEPSNDTGQNPSDDTGRHPSDDTAEPAAFLAAVDVLTRHVERLEGELAETKAALAGAVSERDAERLRAAQVDALRAVLEVERDGARAAIIAVEAERDRWHVAATAPRGLSAFVDRFLRRSVG